MKQKIYIFGVLTSLIVFAGAIFKVNHFPGAGILLTIGLMTLVLFFLPVALINHYKSEESSQNKLLYFVTWLTCFVIFTSMLFKLMHWPYAGVLLTVAIPFPYVVFLPVFLSVTSKNKNFNIYNTVFVLFLLTINSVFAALLALNVAKDRIIDSYDLSRNYNNLETVLSQLPDHDLEMAVNLKIDEVLKIVDEYQDLIFKELKQENINIEQWKNNQNSLWRPDSRGDAAKALMNSSESYAGENLAIGLKDLIREMENTPGFENMAKNMPEIFDFREPAGREQEWSRRIFNDTQIAWTLIYLDGLRANLLIIRTSGQKYIKAI